MINTFVNISGKLPRGLVELYQDVLTAADPLGIRILVVGAMARDLILVHGYGAKIERGTRDIDFGANVASWNDFHTLKNELVKTGFEEAPALPHRLKRIGSDDLPWEIDIIPFGEITSSSDQISWPPGNDFVMSTLGFDEAEKHSISVRISEESEHTLSVAAPAGIALLKLISWLERDHEKKPKDASDIHYIISTYNKIPEIDHAIYGDGYMEAQDWDEPLANAMKLGSDAAAIATEKTSLFLLRKLFDQPEKLRQLAGDMSGYGYDDPGALLSVFVESFRADSQFIEV